MPPSSVPADHSSSSQAPPPAQVIGKAILAAASAHDQAFDTAGNACGCVSCHVMLCLVLSCPVHDRV
jgi:hypothetical protein